MTSPTEDIESLLADALTLANTGLIRSGTLPSSEDSRRIISIVDTLSNAKVNDRKSGVNSAQAGRIQDVVALCRASLAPVRRIPREVLIIIFALALPDDWCTLTVKATFNVTGVCYAWREVALDIPRFWTNICLTQSSRTQALAARLQRSAGQLLKVTIFSGERPGSDEKIVPNHDALRLAFSESQRWSRLSLQDFHKSMAGLAPHWPHEFPELKGLLVDCGHEVPECLRRLESAPHLWSFQLKLKSTPEPIVLPTAWRLMNLDLSSFADDGCNLAQLLRPIAACAPYLMRLVIEVYKLGEVEDQFSPIQFPQLSSLALTNAACHLCRWTVAPHLTQLQLHGGTPGAGENPSYLESALLLLSRSYYAAGKSDLQVFEVEDMRPVVEEAMVLCLQWMPCLLSLIVVEDHRVEQASKIITTPFLLAMMRSPYLADPKNLLLPMLVTLELKTGGVGAQGEIAALMRAVFMSRKQYVDESRKLLELQLFDTDVDWLPEYVEDRHA